MNLLILFMFVPFGLDTLVIGLVVSIVIIIILLLAIGFIVLRSHATVRQVMVDQKQMLLNATKMLETAQSTHLPIAVWAVSNLKGENLLDGHSIYTMVHQAFGVRVYTRKLKIQKSNRLKIVTMDTCKRTDIPIYEHNSLKSALKMDLHGSVIQNVDKKKIFVLMEPSSAEFDTFYQFLGSVPVPTVVRLCKGNFGNLLSAISSVTMTSSTTSDEVEPLWFSSRMDTWECCQVNKCNKRYGTLFDLNLQAGNKSNKEDSLDMGIGVQLMCLSGWNSSSNPPLLGVCDILFLVQSSQKAGDTLIIECETGCDKSMIFLMALLTIKMLSEFKLVSMLELVNFLRQMRFGSFTHDNMKSQLNTSMVIVAAYLKKYRPDLLQRSINDDIGTTV